MYSFTCNIGAVPGPGVENAKTALKCGRELLVFAGVGADHGGDHFQLQHGEGRSSSLEAPPRPPKQQKNRCHFDQNPPFIEGGRFFAAQVRNMWNICVLNFV